MKTTRSRTLRALKQLIERLEDTSRLDPRQATKARTALRALEKALRNDDRATLKKAVDEVASVFVVISELQPPE